MPLLQFFSFKKKGDIEWLFLRMSHTPPEGAKEIAECFMKASQIPEYMTVTFLLFNSIT